MMTSTNIPQGYKSSPVGVIPKDWEVKRLGEIGIFVKGYGVPKDHIKKVGHPCLTYGDLYTKYDVVIKNIQSFIDDEDAATSQKIYDGDILFAGSGETPEDIGRCAAYIDKQIAYAGGDIIILRPTIPYNNLVLSYILNSDIGGRQRYKMAQGHSVVHIYPCNLEKISIPLPPLAEQERIAELLGTWDKAIEMQKQLIEKLEVRKKGLMQQLLTGKKRLPGFTEKWKKVRFSDIYVTISAKKYQIPTSKYGQIGKYPIIDQGQNKIIGFTNEECVFTNLPIIVFGDHTRIVKWIDFPFVIGADGVQLLATTPICDTKFAYYVLCNTRIKNLGYSRHLRLLKSLSFTIPSSMEEQVSLTQLFSVIDDEIMNATQKLASFQSQKKGLMQVLLTGKKRVSLS